MITLHFENLLLFIPQYLIATLVSLFIYLYLGRRLPGWKHTIPLLRKTRNLGTSNQLTPVSYRGNCSPGYFSYEVSFYSTAVAGIQVLEKPFFDLLHYFSINRYPGCVYSEQVYIYQKPPIYESRIIFQIYRIMLAVSAWAGLMLVITPFSYINVFLPHFNSPFNVIVAIILSIAIFEGILSAIFFRIGTSLGNVMLVEGLVMIVFTFSILSPSMSWLSLFTLNGRVLIYLILLLLFTIIAALISQLRTARNLFMSSFIFSTISYFSFVVIVLYNVIQILGF